MTAPDPRLGEIEARVAGRRDLNFIDRAATESQLIDSDVAYLLAELRKRDAALARVEALAAYLDSLAPGDKHYAELFRAAVAAAAGGGE